MTQTIYTIHAAFDHRIVKTFTVQDDPTEVATILADEDNIGEVETRRYYVHNGLGVVSAFYTRKGGAFQILRDDYMKFKDAGSRERAKANIG